MGQQDLFTGQENVLALPSARGRVTHRGQPVPDSLVNDAASVLGYFNERTSSRLQPFTAQGQPSESLRRIIGAMVTYPEVRVMARRMIDRQLADPWWKGRPTVGAIFGPAVVQQSIEAAQRARNGRPAPAQDWPAARDHLLSVRRERRMWSGRGAFAAMWLRQDGFTAAAAWVERVGLDAAIRQAEADDPSGFAA
jgi:hypothetical protein